VFSDCPALVSREMSKKGTNATYAPVAVFVYNRLWHTRQTIEALQKNGLSVESDLFIFSDAPKTAGASVAVQQVREYVSEVSGFKTVTVVERPKNFGLANSIIDGVTRLCNEYDRVIVIEDDLVTSPYFLEYMNVSLDQYANDEKVMQIAGYMFPVKLDMEEDALFLPFITSWGWATWRRAWRYFDPRAQGFEQLRDDTALRKQFDLNGYYNYYKMLQSQKQGKVDSWAIRWYLSVFLRHGLALYPRKSMVRNNGFDGSGVNCAASKFHQEDLDTGFHVSVLPQSIDVSVHADMVIRNVPAPKLNLSSILNRLTGLFNGRS